MCNTHLGVYIENTQCVLHRALVSRCRGDVKVVSRLMSSSVSRLSSLMGCVRMSRCVEVCRGHVEGLSVKVSRHEGLCRGLNSDTVCMTVKIQLYAHTFSYKATSLGVLLHPLHHRLLTVRLQLVVLKLGGRGQPSPVLEAVGPKLHKAVDGPEPEEEVSSQQE